MVMLVFAYIYYQSFVMVQDLPVEMILEQVIWTHHPRASIALLRSLAVNSLPVMQILRNLTLEEQHALYEQLGKLLTRGY